MYLMLLVVTGLGCSNQAQAPPAAPQQTISTSVLVPDPQEPESLTIEFYSPEYTPEGVRFIQGKARIPNTPAPPPPFRGESMKPARGTI